MELNLNLDPKQINEFMAAKLLESALGEQIKKAVTEQVGKWSTSWDNPAKGVVEQFIRDTANELLHGELKEQVKEKLRAYMTDEVLDKMAQDAISKLTINGSRY